MRFGRLPISVEAAIPEEACGSQAVGVGRLPLDRSSPTPAFAGSATKGLALVQPNLQSPSGPDIADRVRSILETRNLTLSRLSQLSAQLYGHSSPYFVPHTLYHDLRAGALTPSLQQVCALSRITQYELMDWFLAFGFDLEKIPQLQSAMPSKRTTIIDVGLSNPNSWVPQFRTRQSTRTATPAVPLGQLIEITGYRRAVTEALEGSFIVAKVGSEDALGFPEILPGSIILAKHPSARDLSEITAGTTSEKFFLVEHGRGLSCCRIHFAARDRIVLLSNQLPYAQVELRIPGEALVRGVLDQELRFLTSPEPPRVPKELATPWAPESFRAIGRTSIGTTLRIARLQVGLSFREASAKSAQIAESLRDDRYFAAAGSLSDYESLRQPPRRIHKVMTLCILYGLPLSAFLSDFSLMRENGSRQPIPDHLIPRVIPQPVAQLEEPERGVHIQELVTRLHRPFLAGGTLEVLSGISRLTINDFFWIEGCEDVSPHLKGSFLAIANRHKKKPSFFRSKAFWQQPLYLLLNRDGTYICACCSVEYGELIVHPCSGELQPPKRLMNERDVEVVGQIAMIVKRIA